MFSVEQKRNIANRVQQILRNTGHPELPVGEIQFKLYVHGRYQWSWINIQNNAAVPIPSVNPHNEAQAQKCTSPDPQYGREPDKVKSLAQYLAEYIEHEIGLHSYNPSCELLEQALDAYQLTENVTIKIERV